MTISKSDTSFIISSGVYFLLSTVITWWFIVAGKQLYVSDEKMLWSCAIAGAKWNVQIIFGLLFLKEKKWAFVNKIGFVCFVGSCILLPFCFFKPIQNLPNSFLYSLILAVITMIILYYKGVNQLKISQKWFFAWIFCLIIAISLQIFVVF